MRKSEPKDDAFIDTDIDSVRQIVLEPKRLDPKVRLFRLRGLYEPVLLDTEIAEEMKKAGFEGPTFKALAHYRS